MPKTKTPAPPELVVVGDVTYEVRPSRWEQIGIGSILLDSGGRRWTCIAAAQPQQYEYGKTCWLKFIAPKGEEVTIAPRYVNHRVNLLIDPTADPIQPAYAEGGAEAWLLAQELGATEIATQDKATGEVWCPDYIFETGVGLGLEDMKRSEGLLMHLEVCHNVDTAGLRVIEDHAEQHAAVHEAHDHAHKHPVGGAGFTHRHVPEDHTIL